MQIKNFLKYSLFKNKIDLPIDLILLITAKCNSNCPFCFFKDRLNKGQKELSFNELKELSRSLKKLNRLIVSGGEPFLRNDLPEICELFSLNNEIDELTIPTNGLAPEVIEKATEKILKKLKKTNLMISLSIDAPPPLNDKIRGIKNSFEKAFETYKRLSKLKKKYSIFRVHVTTTISKYNYKNLNELVELIKQKMPDLNGHNFELIRNKHSEYCEDLPLLENVEKIINLENKLNSQKQTHFSDSKWKSKLATPIKNFKNNLILETLKQQKQIIPCFAGKATGVINEVGDVFLCELLPSVGNIRKTSFLKAWNSEKANQQRKMIAQKKCWCTHSCFQGTSLLYNSANYFKMLKYIIFKK